MRLFRLSLLLWIVFFLTACAGRDYRRMARAEQEHLAKYGMGCPNHLMLHKNPRVGDFAEYEQEFSHASIHRTNRYRVRVYAVRRDSVEVGHPGGPMRFVVDRAGQVLSCFNADTGEQLEVMTADKLNAYDWQPSGKRVTIRSPLGRFNTEPYVSQKSITFEFDSMTVDVTRVSTRVCVAYTHPRVKFGIVEQKCDFVEISGTSESRILDHVSKAVAHSVYLTSPAAPLYAQIMGRVGARLMSDPKHRPPTKAEHEKRIREMLARGGTEVVGGDVMSGKYMTKRKGEDRLRLLRHGRGR